MPFAKQFLPVPAQDRMNRSCRGNQGETPQVLAPRSEFLLLHQMPYLSLQNMVFKSRAERREQVLSRCSGEAMLEASSHYCFPKTKIDALVSHRHSVMTPAPSAGNHCDTWVPCQRTHPHPSCQHRKRDGGKEGGREERKKRTKKAKRKNNWHSTNRKYKSDCKEMLEVWHALLWLILTCANSSRSLNTCVHIFQLTAHSS